MSPLRLGIIGCGIAARDLHWPALKHLRNRFRVVAVCNHTEPKARRFSATAGGVPYVLDYRELLARKDIEAVDIALPIHLNHEVAAASLRAGKHVFLEKPLAATVAEGRRLVSLAERSSCVAMVAENFRYRAVYRRAAVLLRRGEIGKPYAVQWTILSHMTLKNKYARTTWRQHPRYAGGFVTDGGIHNIAALRMLLGEIRPVRASAARVNPKLGPMDSILLHFESEGGVPGVLTLCFSAIGQDENRLTVLGKTGSMVIDDDVIRLTGKKTRTERISDDWGFRAQFVDFHNAVRHSVPVASSFAEGYADLRTVLAAVAMAG
jgi:predicted dehydrogenase